MLKMSEEISSILELGYALSTEQYYQKLFDIVLHGCMDFTSADSGILYLVDNMKLKCLTHVNKTLDSKHQSYNSPEEVIDIKAHNMVSYTAAHKKILRVDDIYQERQFDILRIKEFDVANGYKTQSLMVVPIFAPNNKVLGVMQLFNCTDDDNNIVAFPEEYEKIVSSLTSQMAITLMNMMQIQELDELLDSFVQSMTTAIDARTPYNANHTRHVADLCMEFIDYVNALHTRGEFRTFFGENDREQLKMAAELHDLGKMITPREVLNKATRLGDHYDSLHNKLEKIQLMMKIDMLEGVLDSTDWAMEDLRLSNFIAELPGLNQRDRLTDSELYRINEMAKKVYVMRDGTRIPYLDDDERRALNIVKGTLTAEERKIVEQHVVFTDTMLDKIKFNEKYNRVRRIASRHHEYLNGTGYPNQLEAKDLDSLTRILTIVDIYDSLTSNDRPYKGTVPVDKALDILMAMVNEGKLDKELVTLFSDYIKKTVFGRY